MQYNYKKEILNKYRSLFKGSFEDLMKAFNARQPKAIRANTLKIHPERLKSLLEKQGFILKKVSWLREGFFIVKEPFNISTTLEYLHGLFFIQDPSSMSVAHEMDLKPSDLVLDMTAAPGGKTTHMAQILKNKGVIVAVDSDKDRMPALKNNIERCGVENVIAFRMDAHDIPSLNLKFDKILLDAPCTGEGTVRKNPARKESLSIEEYAKYSKIQRSLLQTACSLLKKGGLLIYSTCSISPEENEEQIEYAVKELGFTTLALKNTEVSKGLTQKESQTYLKNCGRFYPHIHNTQGFFIAKLRKD